MEADCAAESSAVAVCMRTRFLFIVKCLLSWTCINRVEAESKAKEEAAAKAKKEEERLRYMCWASCASDVQPRFCRHLWTAVHKSFTGGFYSAARCSLFLRALLYRVGARSTSLPACCTGVVSECVR